jgi:pimeloyl-ACP methyl ester carboxylesterase
MAVQPQREEDVSIAAPSKLLLLLEGRAFAEFSTMMLTLPWLRKLPRGDGHPVMLIPGFGTTDGSMQPMRRLLQMLGYKVYGWNQGRNLGMRKGMREKLAAHLQDIHLRHDDKKVSLIGWSLGGVFARELARAQPELVRRVFTLGSPINGHPSANNVEGLFRFANRKAPPKLDWDGFQRRRTAPPVPCTAIYSKTDGVVAWQCSLEEPADNTENVEVFSSHFGLGVNPQVLKTIAERLAKPE